MSVHKTSNKDPKGGKRPTAHKSLRVVEDKPFERFEDHEWYKFKLKEYEIFSGKFGECVRLKWKCLNGLTQSGESAVGLSCSTMMSATCSPSTKLYEFLTVLRAGKEPKVGEEVDISAYYGLKVMGFIEDKKEKGKKTAEENCFQNVTKIKALKKKVE